MGIQASAFYGIRVKLKSGIPFGEGSREEDTGMKRITIDPITRLEGHGKIELFLNDSGDVENAYFVVPELRGFEKFCEGRPVEELPRIVPRICGV